MDTDKQMRKATRGSSHYPAPGAGRAPLAGDAQAPPPWPRLQPIIHETAVGLVGSVNPGPG